MNEWTDALRLWSCTERRLWKSRSAAPNPFYPYSSTLSDNRVRKHPTLSWQLQQSTKDLLQTAKGSMSDRRRIREQRRTARNCTPWMHARKDQPLTTARAHFLPPCTLHPIRYGPLFSYCEKRIPPAAIDDDYRTIRILLRFALCEDGARTAMLLYSRGQGEIPLRTHEGLDSEKCGDLPWWLWNGLAVTLGWSHQELLSPCSVPEREH